MLMETGLWPYIYIAIAGWIATDMWRWLGVLAGNRLREDSAALSWVRAVATALVAGVIAKLLVYPTGTLSETPLLLRVLAASTGFGLFLLFGQRIIVGIAVSQTVLISGLLLFPPG